MACDTDDDSWSHEVVSILQGEQVWSNNFEDAIYEGSTATDHREKTIPIRICRILRKYVDRIVDALATVASLLPAEGFSLTAVEAMACGTPVVTFESQLDAGCRRRYCAPSQHA